MGIHDLQTFLESTNLEGGSVSVDLLRIAKNLSTQRSQTLPHRNKNKFNHNRKLKLVLDAECCLDRLYGGYFSDWACGGQWNRTVQFLSLLMQAIEGGNIEFAVIFNGALEPQRMPEWIAEQQKIRQKINMVLKHINTKGTPPPKVWWCPPTCLRTVLRMALRHLSTTVMCSMDDHHQEVIAYCRENGFHGIVADDAEYAAFDPPRYFSSENLKLTYKGSLETKEFMVGEMKKILNLSQEQLCVLAALLGNYMLPEHELVDVYRKAGITTTPTRASGEEVVRALAEFVRAAPSVAQMDALVAAVFGSADDKRAPTLRQSIHYFMNGTAEGFLKYRTATNKRGDTHTAKGRKQTNQQNNVSNAANTAKHEDQDLDTSGFASETTEREQKSLEDYKLATVNAVLSPEIVIDGSDNDKLVLKSNTANTTNTPASTVKTESSSSEPQVNGPQSVNGAGAAATVKPVVGAALLKAESNSTSCNSSMSTSPRHQPQDKPRVSAEVMRTATERHQKGLMSPIIYHALVSNEVRLACVMEDEKHWEIPPAHLVFRPIRQKVYAILFNLHHLQYLANKNRAEIVSEGGDPSTIPTPSVSVREWTWSRSNQYERAEAVRAEPLGWAVPTLQRLWFGGALDDKRRRLRAFLTCLRSDSPLMLNASYVPQHMLILACVLRYMMSHSEVNILRKQELDAFIAQAFAPDLMNSQYLQELTLPLVTSRGVQLAALFMHGVEMALLANDACGAPIPWLMSCPWLYFDGKLFHHTLARAALVKNLLELCENHIERVVKVERMRKAILEGLDVQFAKPPMPPMNMIRSGLAPNCLPPVNLPSTRGAGVARRPVAARGGQLQVAGVVVGQWGANYGFSQHPVHRSQVSAGYGNIGRGRGVAPAQGYTVPGRGFPLQHKNNRGPSWPTNKKAINNKKKNPTKKTKGRSMTVQLQTGETVAVSQNGQKKNDSNNEGVKSTSETVFEDAKSSEHKGQGDGPILNVNQ